MVHMASCLLKSDEQEKYEARLIYIWKEISL